MKKRIGSILLTAFLLLAGCAAPQEIAPTLLEPAGTRLDVAVAEIGEIYQVSAYAGSVVPHTEAVYFQKSGTLSQICVSLGQTVQQGDILATLDGASIQMELDAIQDQINYIVKMGTYQDRLAEIDMEILREEAAGLSEGELSVIAADLAIMEAQLRQAQELRDLEIQHLAQKRDALRQELNSLALTAPFTGQVVYLAEASIGSSVHLSEPMIYLADESRLTIETAYVSPSVLENADRIEARILDTAYAVTYLPYEDSEYVSMLLTGEEPKTQFTFAAPTDAVSSGQFAAITVTTNYKANTLTIPVHALYRDEQGHYVYLVEDGQRIRRDVTTGQLSATKAEILDGLQEGDEVYVAG